MKNTSKRIFIKIFLSYVLFMMIPFIAVGYIYQSSIRIIAGASRSDSFHMLLQVKNMVDVRLKEVGTISGYIAKNPDLITVLKYDRNYVRSNLLDVYKLYNSIPRFQLSNSIIDEIYMLGKNSKIIVSPGSACVYTENLHSSLFPDINYNYSEWNDFLWNNKLPDNYMLLESSTSRTHSNLVYLRALPDALSSSHPGALYIRIKNSFFTGMLKRVDTGKKGVVCIIDGSGKVVSSVKEEGFPLDLSSVFPYLSERNPNAGLDDYIINSVQSDINNWTYYSIIPKQIILSQVSYIKNMILFLTLLAFAAGCVIACRLASQKAIMLKRTIGYLSGTPAPETAPAGNSNEYRYIEHAVSHLVSNNQDLSERLSKQKDTIRTSMMRTLIFGDFYNKDDFDNLLENSGLDFSGRQYAVMTISILHPAADKNNIPDDHCGIVRLFLKEIAEQLSGNQMYILDIDEKTMAAIILFDASLPEDGCHEFIHGITATAYNECLSRYGITLKFAVSFIYNHISRIHRAYEQSKQLSEYLLSESDCGRFIIYGSDQPLPTDLYYYPIEVELKLIQHVKYGDYDLLGKLLREIKEENFKNRDLSQAMKKQLVFAMRGTIIRGLRNIVLNEHISEMIHELDTAVSMEDIFNYANRISLEICRIVAAKRNENEEKLKKKIFEYIESSYKDSSFCIHRLADHFNLTENFIYQYFRENIGVPFSTVLENKRIEKACELLKNAQMQIKEIALAVGYNNDISFRRAFKRVMGVLPLEYEKTIK